MPQKGRQSTLEWVRQLTLSVEQLIAQGLASGAMRGILKELERGLPRWTQFLQGLADRLNHRLEIEEQIAEQQNEELRVPGQRMRTAASGAVEGALQEIKTAMPDLSPLAAGLAADTGRGLLEGAGATASEHSDEFLLLVERLGQSVVRSMAGQLEVEIRARSESMNGTRLRETSREVTSGVLAAIAQRLRIPFLVATGAAGAVLLGFALKKAR